MQFGSHPYPFRAVLRFTVAAMSLLKKIVINFMFGIFLPGFQDRFHHRTGKMFAVYLKFAQ